HDVSCREARAIPLGTRAGARELPELPPAARLESRKAALPRGAAAVPGMPLADRQPELRSPRRAPHGAEPGGSTQRGRPADEPQLPELPHAEPRLESTGGRG